MKRLLICFLVMLTACVHESAIPLGDNLAQVDVSTAPVYGRAGAQRIAMENAAKFTLKMGYNKFRIVNNAVWQDKLLHANASSVANNNGAASNASVNEMRHPESKITIRMYHNGEKGSQGAIDAQKYLDVESQ